MLGSNALRSNEVHPPRRMAASQALRSKVSRGKRPCGRFLSRVAGRCAAGDGLIRERRRIQEQTRDAVVADSRGRTYAPLGRRRGGIWAVMCVALGRRLLVILSILAPQSRSAPLPLVGEGLGVGVVRLLCRSRHRDLTAPPSPPLPHKGGGSRPRLGRGRTPSPRQ